MPRSSLPAPATPPNNPAGARPANWQDLVIAEATAQKIPPALALALVNQESGFNPAARSPVGAIGLMQLMPQTARELGVDPNDPVQNIKGGMKYLRQQLDAHGGDVQLALAAYNAGPGAVADAKGVPPFPETQQYITRILGSLPRFHAQVSGQPAPQPTVPAVSGPQGGRGAPPPQRQPGSLPPPPPQAAQSYLSQLAEGFDPRTSEGRRNLAGMAGGTAAAVLSGGGSIIPSILIGMAGAGTAGALEESIEQGVGTKPESGSEVLKAGASQAAYEGVGQIGSWGVRAVGNRLLASPVAQNAVKALERMRAGTAATLDRALTGAEDVLRTTRRTAADDIRAVRSATGADVAAAKADAAAEDQLAKFQAGMGVRTAEQRAAGDVATVAGRYAASTAGPPTPTAAGRYAQRMIEGPAQSFKDEVGRLVEETAEAGPNLDLTTVRERAQAIFDQQIKDVASYFHAPTNEAEEAAVAQATDLLSSMEKRGASEADKLEFLNALRAAGVPLGVAEATWETAKHPAMGVIQKILRGEAIVPFRAAHQLKRLLDEGVNWESPAKKQLQQITKGLRSQLRSVMGSFDPYNAATGAYEHLAKLFGNKSLVGTFRKVAENDPEALVRLISPKNPTKVRLLREVLVQTSGKGGNPVGGQAAWDMVRSAWTSQNILSKGLDGLEGALAGLDAKHGEFLTEFYGDRTGQKVLQNLRDIAQAYRRAVDGGKLAVETAKTAGKDLIASTAERGSQSVAAAEAARAGQLETVRATGRQAVRGAQDDVVAAQRARRAAMKPTALETKLGTSTLAKFEHHQPEEVVADIARATLMSPLFGGKYASIGRLIRGPASKDMLEWAAYSPTATKLLVQALNSPAPVAALNQIFGGSARAVVGGLMGPPPPQNGIQPTGAPAGVPGGPPAPRSRAAAP